MVVCKTTHRVALEADKQSANGRNKDAKLQNAVQLLQDSYSKTFNDRTEYQVSIGRKSSFPNFLHPSTRLWIFSFSSQPGAPYDSQGSKKAGVLSIVNELFAMYFRLNILRLCKNLIRPVESRKLHQGGTMGQIVTYKFYKGRLDMFEDQHASAEMNLDYAFRHCHRNAPENKKRILRYLVPIKLYRGRLPTPHCKKVTRWNSSVLNICLHFSDNHLEVLEKYGLHEFEPLVDGIRKGDLRTFQDGLLRFQHLFIR